MAHSRKQLVDLGAHRHVLTLLSALVHTNEKKLEGKTAAQVTTLTLTLTLTLTHACCGIRPLSWDASEAARHGSSQRELTTRKSQAQHPNPNPDPDPNPIPNPNPSSLT